MAATVLLLATWFELLLLVLVDVALLVSARFSRAGLISPSVIIESVAESLSPWAGACSPFLLGMDEGVVVFRMLLR